MYSLFDCFGPTVSCDVCGKILNSFGCCVSPADLAAADKGGLCNDCSKAVSDAKEQRNNLNFYRLQQVIKQAIQSGITTRQISDKLETMHSTIERYIQGVAKPRPHTCAAMIKIVEEMIDGRTSK